MSNAFATELTKNRPNVAHSGRCRMWDYTKNLIDSTAAISSEVINYFSVRHKWMVWTNLTQKRIMNFFPHCECAPPRTEHSLIRRFRPLFDAAQLIVKGNNEDTWRVHGKVRFRLRPVWTERTELRLKCPKVLVPFYYYYYFGRRDMQSIFRFPFFVIRLPLTNEFLNSWKSLCDYRRMGLISLIMFYTKCVCVRVSWLRASRIRAFFFRFFCGRVVCELWFDSSPR